MADYREISELSEQEQMIYKELTAIRDQAAELEQLASLGGLKLPEVKNTGLKGFFQKIIKKLLDWYMEPILAQQNAFNQKVIQVVRSMAEDH